MRYPKRRFIVFGILLLMILGVPSLLYILNPPGDLNEVKQLPDGSTLRIEQIAFVSGQYNYQHNTGGRWMKLLRQIAPAWLRNKLGMSGGGFGFDLGTNKALVVITLNKLAASNTSSVVGRLRVYDHETNRYDARWGAHTLGMMGETIHGWQIQAFPRRSRRLHLEFLAMTPKGGWQSYAVFQIPNPAYHQYEQWTPEPLPITKKQDDLAMTLASFESGERMPGRHGKGSSDIAGRRTRLQLEFNERGQPSSDWRVHRLTFSDATGNRWSPFLNLQETNFTWAAGGTAQIFGALWPGENAWMIDVEVTRTNGFDRAQLWQVAIPLPAPKTVAPLTNAWSHDNTTVKLIGLASPGTDHSGDFQWLAKWWGEEKDKVYSLAAQMETGAGPRRLALLRGADENGNPVPMLQQHGDGDKNQAFFLKPEADAKVVHLTFALQRGRNFQFLAQPLFIRDEGGGKP